MSTQERDERAGLPSGSGAKRWLTCPGSHMAEATQPDEKTEEATEGEMLHAVMESGESAHRADLTEEQSRCIQFCRETRRRLSEELLGNPEPQAYVEERWWLRNPATLDPVASCRVDWAAFGHDCVLILDWKFGRREVEAADVNDQLRFAAATAWQEYAQAPIYVGIVSPRAEGERVTVARFTADQCEAARLEIVAGALRAMQNGQPRKPSVSACHYCKARGSSACPESTAGAVELAEVPPCEIETPERTAHLLEKCELADRVIEAIRERAKRQLQEGQTIPGWRLKPGNTVKKIIDARAAWARVGQLIGGSAFSEACTVSLTALAKALKASSTHEKLTEKTAREKVEALLCDAIVEKQNSPSLCREVSA